MEAKNQPPPEKPRCVMIRQYVFNERLPKYKSSRKSAGGRKLRLNRLYAINVQTDDPDIDMNKVIDRVVDSAHLKAPPCQHQIWKKKLKTC